MTREVIDRARRWATIGVAALVATAPQLAGADPATRSGRAPDVLAMDRAALHRAAVAESLVPVRPGIPGKRSFWNASASSFMYAPAFDFGPVKGSQRYRFTLIAYGTQRWTFRAVEPDASLAPLWSELPQGRLLVERLPLDERGNVRWAEHAVPPHQWVHKHASDGAVPRLSIESAKPAASYRYTVWAAKELSFEALHPWASLDPIWADVPVGDVVLHVEGLRGTDGRALGPAVISKSSGGTPLTHRRFHRKAVFAGPYHDAAADYRESAHRWLDWLARNEFRQWAGRRPPQKLRGYPSKFVGAAISGMAALALMESNPQRRADHLRVAAVAAKALMATSFPADSGLPHFPPTYDRKSTTVMTRYPASVGMAYLDLYDASGDSDLLDAARRIADTYRKTQRPTGSWPLLMDARTGQAMARSSSELMPDAALAFFQRLIDKHGFIEYRPMADAAWRWIEREVLPTFRLEGQFEDTSKGGGRRWNLSHYPATRIATHLFARAPSDPSSIELAEELIRFAEDQFVIWEQPIVTEINGFRLPKDAITPAVLEQYVYMVPISAGAADLLSAFQRAYEVTGKELYLAKAAAMANVMTAIQADSRGGFVGTYWSPRNPGGWPNAHVYGARVLAGFADFVQQRNMRLKASGSVRR